MLKQLLEQLEELEQNKLPTLFAFVEIKEITLKSNLRKYILAGCVGQQEIIWQQFGQFHPL